jgi:hypothetical protein
VAADLDRDGDLDIIGIDVALDLVVWINDGTGQLRSRPVARSHGWRAESPGPSLEHQLSAAETVAPGDPSSARPASRIDPLALDALRSCLPSLYTIPRSQFAPTRTPRAPPAPTLLT